MSEITNDRKTVELKNGTDEFVPLVAVTMLALRKLIDTWPMVFYDLVMLCRDHTYKPWGDAPEKLADLQLATRRGDGSIQVHDSIRNVVLSAAVGDGMDMSLVDPREGEEYVGDTVRQSTGV